MRVRGRIWVIVALVVAILAPCVEAAEHIYLEKEYQEVWCRQMGGVTEYVLDDKTRVDCLTDEYAIEFDFAAKWAESIGQALYYGLKTSRKPGVVLIIEREADRKYLPRLAAVAAQYGIQTWTMAPEAVERAVR